MRGAKKEEENKKKEKRPILRFLTLGTLFIESRRGNGCLNLLNSVASVGYEEKEKERKERNKRIIIIFEKREEGDFERERERKPVQ